jgi:hypothetical protein
MALNFKEQYDAFNAVNNDLFLILIGFFPHVSKIQYYHTLFTDCVKSNYKLAGKFFLKTVGPYYEQIINQDALFFKQELSKNASYVIDIIIKEWDNMSDEQKDTIWFYLKRLLFMITNIDDDYECDIDTTKEACMNILNT